MNKKLIGKNLDKYLFIPLTAILLTVVVQQYFFSSNERERQQIEVKRELLKEQYRIFQKIERLVELGEPYQKIIFQNVYLDDKGDVFAEDKEGITISIPSIVNEKESQKEWFELTEEIISQKEKIDLDVYRAFEEVYDFVEKHPFPERSNNLDIVLKSLWSEGEVMGRWSSINKYLKLKIENKKQLTE